jgi:hypothetical protein
VDREHLSLGSWSLVESSSGVGVGRREAVVAAPVSPSVSSTLRRLRRLRRRRWRLRRVACRYKLLSLSMLRAACEESPISLAQRQGGRTGWCVVDLRWLLFKPEKAFDKQPATKRHRKQASPRLMLLWGVLLLRLVRPGVIALRVCVCS